MTQQLLRAVAMLIPKGAPPGQQAYTTAGTYSWTCPAGVTSISVVVVGSGGGGGMSYNYAAGGGGGGGLEYANNISVTPGSSYSVKVGLGGARGSYSTGITSKGKVGEDSYFDNYAYATGGTGGDSDGGTYPGGTGGNGQLGSHVFAGGNGCHVTTSSGNGGAGGAAGYSGNGGNGSLNGVPSGAGSGGGGSGSAGSDGNTTTGGGGVGLLGEGASGASTTGLSGLPGSGGVGPLYGGGGAADIITRGGVGAVRIIWPGNVRQFPSTRTTDE